MVDDELRGKYKGFLAGLYPGTAIDPPATITIGGESPPISVDFGVVKDDGTWRIPAAFADLAEPLLLREAYRAGFPEKTARTAAMTHACNWFAWRSISTPALQKKFYNAWFIASEASEPRADKYKLPPTLIREFDKALDADPRELHELLVRYSAENERLLGKQLRYDAAEQWAFHKAMEFAPVPSPAVVELLFSAAILLLARKEPPSRDAIVDQALRGKHFTVSPAANTFKDAFPTFSNLAFVGMQVDVALAGQRYAYAFFTPSARAATLDWGGLLRFPGMFHAIDQLHGTPMPGEGTRPPMFARFCVPATALEALGEYFAALEACGLVTSHELYYTADAWFSTNFNCYVPHPVAPAFVVQPIRDEATLHLRTAIDMSPPPARSAALLAAIAAEDIAGIQRFLRKAGSPFSFDAARHSSWLTTVADQAGISTVVARRWHDLLVHQHGFLVPEPRNNYFFVSHVGVMSHLSVLVPGHVPVVARSRFLAAFPATVSSTLRGVHCSDATFIKAFVPRLQLGKAIQLAYQHFPNARIHVDQAASLAIGDYMPIAWFDGTGYPGAIEIIQRYSDAIPSVGKGAWTVARFQQAVEHPPTATWKGQ